MQNLVLENLRGIDNFRESLHIQMISNGDLMGGY